MKKAIALLLVLVMAIGLAACQPKQETPTNQGNTEPQTNPEPETFKVGLVVIGDENDQGYTYNFLRGQKAAQEKLKADGLNVEWIIKYNCISGAPVVDANQELVEEGCKVIFNNSYDHAFAIADLVKEYPEIQFVGMTNENFYDDGLDNTSNAFANIYEGRYLAGIVAGMKLNELIEKGTITADKAIVGYVGAFNYAEVVSGYTAYFLGIRSVCPSATMIVKFVDSWSDPTAEGDAAKALIADGAVLISQHADNTNAAVEAEKAGVFHTGYNNDMRSVAPNASLVSTRIDWTKYFYDSVKTVYSGKFLEGDYCGTTANGEVVLTDYNTALIAKGTEAAVEEAKKGIANGSVKVFDVSKFTVNGEHLTHAWAKDTDGDWVPDSLEAIIDGEFKESYYQSAPYFAIAIDGITIVE
ncbi:MAG: BMP family ABC transporter substrate-binding protein [Firmicutes bacterium]|nr:BMP family ABC transporter substrate-binding protein [Bacillota bacterium]